MRHCLVLRTASILATCATALVLVPSHASGSEAHVAGPATGVVIHDAQETLRDYCVRDAAGVLWLVLPGGARFELVTSIDDPVIANRGDGAFHPFDAAEVRLAVNEVRFPLQRLRADVFILPYPRRHGLDSAAGPQLVLLSPGVRAIPRAQQHAEVVHELGHVVQYALMPDDRADRWDAYRALRGITDATHYSASSHHADRPHEIFAEDFRVLFGGALAVEMGIENAAIPNPTMVSGLDRFLLALAGASATSTDLAVSQNPARGPVTFAAAAGHVADLDLYDVSGRRVATLAPRRVAAGVEWTWNGADARGRRIGGGVIFARPRGSSAAALRLTVLR